MPKLWQKYINSDSLTGLWRISESEEELRELLSFVKAETFSNPQRTLQWLASRVLLQEVLQEMDLGHAVLHKLLSGRPVLDAEGFHVSISHTLEYAAVVVSNQPIGVDVEMLGNRISRVRHKFMNDADFELLNAEDDIAGMHLVWSAKEALFKYHPEGALDFRQHLHLKKIEEGLLSGQIKKGNEQEDLLLPYEFLQGGVIAWAYADAAVNLPVPKSRSILP
jgi:4'-phosphopantetheinyl transferase